MLRMLLSLALAVTLAGCSSEGKKDKKNTTQTNSQKIHKEASLKVLSSYVKPDAKILDLGTGTGIGPRQLCQNGYSNVIGVEKTEQNVQAAEEAKNIQTCKTEYIVGNITEGLKLPDGEFDMVTAFSAYHCFANPNCVKEVARVLKPEGYYFVARGLLKNTDPVRVKTTEIIEQVTGQKVRDPLFDPEEQLKTQGFNVVLNTTIPIVEYFTKDEYLNYLKTYPSWNLAKNSPKFDEIQSKIEKYLDTLTNEEGVIRIEIQAPVILAQKQK